MTREISAKIRVPQTSIRVVDLKTNGADLDPEDSVGDVLDDESQVTAILQKKDGRVRGERREERDWGEAGRGDKETGSQRRFHESLIFFCISRGRNEERRSPQESRRGRGEEETRRRGKIQTTKSLLSSALRSGRPSDTCHVS